MKEIIGTIIVLWLLYRYLLFMIERQVYKNEERQRRAHPQAGEPKKQSKPKLF